MKEFTAPFSLLTLNREWCHQLIKNPPRFVLMGSSYLHDKNVMVLSRLDFYDRAVKELLVHK